MSGSSFSKPGAAMFNATSALWTHAMEAEPEPGRSWLWVVAILFAIIALGVVAWLTATGRLPFGVG